MEYSELEHALRAEAAAIDRENDEWTAARVANRLQQIADMLVAIRREHQSGINATMGKRSGGKLEI